MKKFHSQSRSLSSLRPKISQRYQEFVKASHHPTDLTEVIQQETINKMINAESNDFTFYNIRKKGDSKGVIKKSYDGSQQSTIQPAAQTKLREQIAQQPGCRLMLSEIYEQLNEEGCTKLPQLEVENIKQDIDGLSKWQLEQKRKQKMRLEKKKLQVNPSEFPQIPSSKPSRNNRKIFQQALTKLQRAKHGNKSVFYHIKYKVEQYLSSGINASVQEIQSLTNIQSDQMPNIDFTIEGLKTLYQTLLKLNLPPFHKESDKSAFYRKQTDFVLQRIEKKLADDEKLMKDKQATLQQLLKETHEISSKISQIRLLMAQLENEVETLKQGNGEHGTQKNHETSTQRLQLVPLMFQQSTKLIELRNDLSLLKESLVNFTSKQQFNREMIEKLEKFVETKKKNIKSLIITSDDFLLYLLSLGQDTRKSGIVWIVQKLQSRRVLVKPENYPKILDTTAGQYIQTKARLLDDLSILQDEQQGFFHNYQFEKQNHSVLSKSIMTELQFDSSKEIDPDTLDDTSRFSQMNLAQIRGRIQKGRLTSQEEQVAQDLLGSLKSKYVKATQNMIQELGFKRVNLTKNDLMYTESKARIGRLMKTEESNVSFADGSVQNYQLKQVEIEKLEREIEKSEKAEIHRIIREFQYRSYGSRFNTDLGSVLSCLCGSAKADRETLKLCN